MTLTPAFGRDYKSKKAVLVDFDANLDFITNPFDGPCQYVNKSQLVELGLHDVTIRYAKLRKAIVVSI